MMKRLFTFFAAAFFIGFPLLAETPKEASNIEILDALIAKDVVARQPVAPGTEFSSGVGQLVFWTKISASPAPAEVFHVWYYDGHEMARIPLTIKSSNWRTWSRKTILTYQVGSWKAAVEDASGTVLKEVEFKIKASSSESE